MEKLIEAAREVLRELVREASGTNDLKLIEQSESPLGRNRHCAAVRRRIAEGKPGAWLIGRRHVLTADALREELDELGRAGAARMTPRKARAELERKLHALRCAK